MQLIKTIFNPLNWIIGTILKLIIRKIFFNKIENKDFNMLFSYTLELLPNETFMSIIKLLINMFKSKPSELFYFSIFNEAITHTIPSEKREIILNKIKYLFIFLVISNIIKRVILITKKIILLPFKLGVYSFIAFLFGIKMDYLLSFFDIFKFNLPSWTYNKLLDLHFSWLNWIKNTLKINSITTDTENPSSLPKFRIPSLSNNDELEVPKKEIKPDTYLYLTKKEWLIVTVSIIFILGAYLGFTGGIPFTKTFEFNSDNNNKPDNEPDNESSNTKGKGKAVTYLWNKETNKLEPQFYEEDLNNNENENLNNKDSENLKGIDFPIKDNNRTIWDTLKKPFSWFSSSNDPAIEEIARRDAEELRIFKEKQNEAEKEWRQKLDYERKVDEEIKKEQLEKKGSLGEIDRDDVRKDYKEEKKIQVQHTMILIQQEI